MRVDGAGQDRVRPVGLPRPDRLLLIRQPVVHGLVDLMKVLASMVVSLAGVSSSWSAPRRSWSEPGRRVDRGPSAKLLDLWSVRGLLLHGHPSREVFMAAGGGNLLLTWADCAILVRRPAAVVLQRPTFYSRTSILQRTPRRGTASTPPAPAPCGRAQSRRDADAADRRRRSPS